MSNIAPIDPAVVLPPSVRAAAQRSQQAYENAYQTAPAETPADEPAEPPAATENNFSAPTADVEPVTPEVTEPIVERADPPAEDQSWEHRYKSMKGRHDRATMQIAQLSEQISNMQNVIATMQVAQTAPAPSGTTHNARLITPEEENDYGEDFLNVVGKRAKEELLPIVQQYESKIASLEAKLEGVGGYVAQDARTRMQATMDAQVPDWRELNFNPDFVQWLKLPDPYSGAIRHDMLKEAYGRNDTARVANFFKGFLAEEAAVDPAERGPDLSGGAATTPPGNKIPLESFAAPGRAKTAAASSAPAEKPSFTRAQIAKFYQDSASGKFRDKEVERGRIEKQIFDAEREGRIR
jgi:hypothetical protein